MKNFMYQTKIHYLRIIGRNKRFLLISLIVPIFFYLLFTNVVEVGYSGEALQVWKANYLVSMIVYGVLMNAIMMVSSTLVTDRDNGFTQFIKLSPLPSSRYYLSMLSNFFFLFVLTIASLLIVGHTINHVTFSFFEVCVFFIVVPLSAVPLVIIGMIVSLTGSANTVSGISNLLVFPMAIVSGLWWPIEMLPTWIQNVGSFMPTYLMVDLIRTLYQKHDINIGDVLGLLIWSVVLIGLLGKMLQIKRQKGY